MIERPEGLITLEVATTFNFMSFKYLEIDLEHINKNSRSFYTAEEVASTLNDLIDNLFLEPSGTKEFGEEICSYFVKIASLNELKYKVVFCICSDRPETIGVITLFRVKE